MSGTNNQVAHLWANQSKASARTSNGNMSFSGPLLYSYSTVIANLLPTGLALFDERSFSTTTAGKHKSPAMRAVGYSNAIDVREPRPCCAADHENNLAGFRANLADLALKAKRSVKYKAMHMESMERQISDANRYIQAFNLTVPVFELDTDYAVQIAAAREAEADRKAATEALAIVREASYRAAWLAGDASAPAPRHGGIVLRVKPSNPAILQTSWGAEVPLADAVKIFRAAARAREHGRPVMHVTSDLARVGDFHLDCIDADGTIHAGCHHIAYAEAARLAQALGIA